MVGEAILSYSCPKTWPLLQKLLSNGVCRIGGQGGDPVVELQTNFGCGKTHSMLALYHLFSGIPSTELSGTEQVLKEAGCEVASKVNRAIVVGTKVSPENPSTKDDGTVIRTIWGEISWQLGGKTGYEMIRADDENATNPGDKMKALFNKFSPCLDRRVGGLCAAASRRHLRHPAHLRPGIE